ncbi:MAG TPA: L-2-amino-thiazoline-4-carboxylic acid hydrolase [Candidatus Krumholzibacteriaceae bacterium]|nr:L-2-amino-thiazoline-4-carboxylic acid hydrolase [Candidatus Krumholzibacteriaceae bacterium]
MEEAAKNVGPMIKLMYNMIGDLSSAFYKKYGKDALPIISSVSAKYGAPNAKLVQKMMPIKNMKDIAEMYKMMFGMIGEKFEIVKVSDDTLHFKVSTCPMCIQGTSQELCEAMMNTDKKMVSTLLNQPINIKVMKSVAAGDKYCEVNFSKK